MQSLQAIILFQDPQAAAKALEKDKTIFDEHHFGKRYVRVTMAEDVNLMQDFNVAASKATLTSKESIAQLPTTTAVKVSGLPPNISLEEIAQLFFGLHIKTGGIYHLGRTADQNCTAVILDLHSAHDAMSAVTTRNKAWLTSREGKFQITATAASPEELKNAQMEAINKNGRLAFPFPASAAEAMASSMHFPSGGQYFWPGQMQVWPGMAMAHPPQQGWWPGTGPFQLPWGPGPAQSGMDRHTTAAWVASQQPVAVGVPRYLVEDLKTGQKVYLDSHFNMVSQTNQHPSSSPSQGPSSYGRVDTAVEMENPNIVRRGNVSTNNNNESEFTTVNGSSGGGNSNSNTNNNNNNINNTQNTNKLSGSAVMPPPSRPHRHAHNTIITKDKLGIFKQTHPVSARNSLEDILPPSGDQEHQQRCNGVDDERWLVHKRLRNS